jgi:hypothetical protein
MAQAFYRMLGNRAMVNLRELYKREMQGVRGGLLAYEGTTNTGTGNNTH